MPLEAAEPATIEAPPAAPALVLFDGVCNLCNRSVHFVIDRDRKRHFKFASLQSNTGQELLKKFNLPTSDFSSMMLIEGDRCYRRSTAALRIARRLKQPWPLLYAFILVPPPLRNLIYDTIARNRYRWFGKEEACRIPTPELRERFLD